jgi:hypothetical protein
MDLDHIFKSLLIGIPVGLVLLVVAWAVYYWITGPVRRRERALLFLDLIGYGLGRGQSPERTVFELSARKETCFGVQFHLVALECSRGRRLSEALASVPEFLSPRIGKIIALGEELGDVAKVLPVCRESVRVTGHQRDGTVATLGLASWTSLLLAGLMALVAVVVLPKLRDLFYYGPGFAADGARPEPTFVGFDAVPILVLTAAVLSVVMLLIANDRFTGLGRFIPLPRLLELKMLLPWVRLRMKRDFAAMLALLLDAGVPEESAVLRAAEATDSRVIAGMGRRMANDIRNGSGLPNAVMKRGLDRSFAWTLTNCLRAGRDFFVSLRSANNAMSLRAERLEQQAATGTVILFTLMNGTIVALCAIWLFHCFVRLIEEAAL